MGWGGTELTIISVYSISLFSETSLLRLASFSKSRRKFCRRKNCLSFIVGARHINDTTATSDLINSDANRTEAAFYLPLIRQLQSDVGGKNGSKVGRMEKSLLKSEVELEKTRNLRIRCCLNRTRARSSWIKSGRKKISDSQHLTNTARYSNFTNLHEFDGWFERIIETEQQQEVLLHGQQLSELSNVDFPVLVVVVRLEETRLQLHQHVVSQSLRERFRKFFWVNSAAKHN